MNGRKTLTEERADRAEKRVAELEREIARLRELVRQLELQLKVP